MDDDRTPEPGQDWQRPAADARLPIDDAPGLSASETLDAATPLGDVLPAAAPPQPRRGRRWIAVSAVAAVLVLVVGGVAAAVLLNRPDVKLQRALDAMTAQQTGSVTMTLQVSGTGDTASEQMLQDAGLRLAWDKGAGAGQVSLRVKDAEVVDLITGDGYLILTQDLAALGAEDALGGDLSSLEGYGRSLGSDGVAIVAFAQGKPVRVSTGEGSAISDLLALAQQQSGSTATPDPAQAQALAERVQKAVRDNVTVTSVGSDDDGEQLRAVFPIKPVVAEIEAYLAQVAGDALPVDLGSQIKGDPTVTVDVWVKDGTVSKMSLPLGQVIADATGERSVPQVTLVMTMGSDGVAMPSEPVTELDDSVIEGLVGGALTGGLGS
jgi:hypothetical protein